MIVGDPKAATIAWRSSVFHFVDRLRRVSTEVQTRSVEVLACVALSCFALAVIGGGGSKIADLDMWHEMALAREFVRSGRLPLSDLFAYTPTIKTVVHHEWGTGVILYGLASVFGPAGILWLNYCVAFAAIAVATRAAIIAGGQFHIAAATVPFAVLVLATAFSPFRAQGFSICFFAVLLYCMVRDRQGQRRWMWFWPPAFVLWANLHGGCVIAIAVLAIEFCERCYRRDRRCHLLTMIAASLLALGCTPYGLDYYGYLWRALTMNRPAINEWMPLWQQPPAPLVWTATAICLSAVAYAITASTLRLSHGAFVLVTMAVGGVLRMKLLDFFAISFIASAPSLLGITPARRFIEKTKESRQFWIATWFAIFWMSVLLLANTTWSQLRVPGEPFGPLGFAYPVGPVTYLAQERFHGNVLAPFDTAAYVSWRLSPNVRVAVDSRYEVAYPASLVDEVFEFYLGTTGRWKEMLAKYRTDVVIVPRSTPLARRMPEVNWRRCYRDRAFDVYVRPGLEMPVVDQSPQEHRGSLP